MRLHCLSGGNTELNKPGPLWGPCVSRVTALASTAWGQFPDSTTYQLRDFGQIMQPLGLRSSYS